MISSSSSPAGNAPVVVLTPSCCTTWNGMSPASSSASAHSRVKPTGKTSSAARSSAVLPEPASPSIRTTQGRPAAASATLDEMAASSSSRPTIPLSAVAPAVMAPSASCLSAGGVKFPPITTRRRSQNPARRHHDLTASLPSPGRSTPDDHFWNAVPRCSSSLISPALRQLAELPVGDRNLLVCGFWRRQSTQTIRKALKSAESDNLSLVIARESQRHQPRIFGARRLAMAR